MMIAAILPHQRAGACRVQDRRQLLRGQERLVHDAIDVTSIGLETSQLREIVMQVIFKKLRNSFYVERK
jgi:hypothetical protein